MEPIRIFIGYDSKEPLAYHVFAHSILRRASRPVSITPVMLDQLHPIFTRARVALQSTEFSFSRFLVPYLCAFKGRAIFADCDQLCFDDIAKVWDAADDRYSIQCVKHDHRPRETTKFLGQVQTSYPMKNWTSFMLMNCGDCYKLTPDFVNTASGLELHRFTWLPSPDLIGELPAGWNHLVGYDEIRGDERHVHFTEGGPWFDAYRDVPFADAWRTEYKHMIGFTK